MTSTKEVVTELVLATILSLTVVGIVNVVVEYKIRKGSRKSVCLQEQQEAVIPNSCIALLRLTSLWPPRLNEDGSIPRAYFGRTLLAYFVCFLPVYASMWHLLTAKTNTQIFLYDLKGCFTYLSLNFMLVSYLGHLDTIVSMATNIGQFFEYSENQPIWRRKRDKFVKLMANIMLFMVLMYGTFKILDEDNCKEMFNHQHNQDFCGLMLSIPVMLDIDFFPVKQLVTIWQMVSILWLYIALAQIYCLSIFAFQQISLNLKELRGSLIKFPAGCGFRFYRQYFKEFVIRHNKIIRTAKMVDRCSYYVLFNFQLASGFITALEIVDVYLNKNAVGILEMLGGFFSLGYLAHICQTIIDDVDVLCNEIYNMKWYDMDIRFKHDILMIMLSTKRPIIFHFGPISVVYLPSFLVFLRASYSYTTMFIKFTNK